MRVQVHVCACTDRCVCTHAQVLLLRNFPSGFLKQSLISLGPTSYSRLAGSHRYLLTSTSTGMVSVHHHSQHFYMVPSDRTKFLLLTGQAFD